MLRIRKAPKGFTLIEILIVVIILGILAAIVIPQFSNATTAAKTSSVLSSAQTLRSQVALYRLQHNDQLPPCTTGTDFWTAMTSYTLADGSTTSAGTTNAIPPYMQSVPNNALYGGSTISVVNGVTYPQTLTTATAWAYDYNSGTGSGRVYGTGTDGLTIVGP